jgi:amidase
MRRIEHDRIRSTFSPARMGVTIRCTAALWAAVAFSGCSVVPKAGEKRPHDSTFITYFPPPKESRSLRLAVKDNIDMEGIVTSAGSEHLYKNSAPAVRDAACLSIARKRDVHIVGKVNLSEFAVAPSGINDYFGTPRSPFSSWRKLIPGGSSCGSAYAVATDKADVAFGTDTAGSVRVPAACCGVVGLKTTFGLVPLEGIVPIEPKHLDTVGPIAKTVDEAAVGMDLLEEGFWQRYESAVLAISTPHVIRIGRLRVPGTDKKIDRAVDEVLAQAGFQIVELDRDFLRKWERAHRDGTVVATAGAWISHGKYATKLGVSARTKSIIGLGAVVHRTQYRGALARRDNWQQTLRETFKSVDFIALPTLKTLPPRFPPTVQVDLIRAKARISNVQNTDPIALATQPLQAVTGIPAFGLRLLGIDLLEADMLKIQNTVAVNFAGNPALAVPIPLHGGGAPRASLQLVGPPLSEAELLAVGRIVEQAD